MQKKELRQDGYKNLLNKYGTKDDVSEHYRFESEEPVSDMELTLNYEENGLFAKIIDLPADEAVSSGFTFGMKESALEEFLSRSLEELNFEECAVTAIKWSRLYGGALIVMLIDDGKELTEPVDWDQIRGIDELLVFERPFVVPDYTSIYQYKPKGVHPSKFGMPEFYEISPLYGAAFRVHESRCLLFKNGILPASSSRIEYRFFGIPEYPRIHKAIQETVTSHGNGVKLLDRAVQAIYKMKNLASLLLTEEGEDAVMQRLQLIDLAKGMINSIAIDADGEEYEYKMVTFSGVKDIIDATCNMLSAVTGIPQTKLFGRSPAGENATGEGDMENYYKLVERIQKLNLKKNLTTLIDVILLAGKAKGEYSEIPEYHLTFRPLWSLSEKEQAEVEKTKVDTEYTKAQTAQVYVEMQALDASEVRNQLAKREDFAIQDLLEEDWEAEKGEERKESEETIHTALSGEEKLDEAAEEANFIFPTGCGVLVIKNGKILVGNRKDNGLLCGPGGHVEFGETPEEAAIREAREEFGIYLAELIPVTILSEMPSPYCPSQIFLCTEFYGKPIAFNDEMEKARFEPVEVLWRSKLFLPFRLSLEELIKQFQKMRFDEEKGGKWITVNGQHILVNERGEVLKGNPNVVGKKQKEEKSKKENTKKEITKPSNSVKIKEGGKNTKKLSKLDRQLADKCPFTIPNHANVVENNKSTYKQKIFSWIEKDKRTGREIEYEARWHERTPNAPKENGETWVITRKDKKTKQIDYLLMQDGKEEWVSVQKWKKAIEERKAGNDTEQSILDKGHIKNKEDKL